MSLGFVLAFELHFENANSGFFFQQSLGSTQQPFQKFLSIHSTSNVSVAGSTPGHDSKLLLRERLVVLGPSQPGRIRVTYGPFEAKQTLPTKFVIPILNFPQENFSIPFDNMEHTLLDITAHVVDGELRRENPVLRVLFHSGKHFHSVSEEEGEKRNPEDLLWEEDPTKMLETCIALKVHNPNGGAPLTSTCVPQGLDGVCLASVTVPFQWWISSTLSPTFPSLTSPVVTPKPSKAVRNVVELSYSVYETKAGQCALHGLLHQERWLRLAGHKSHRHATFPPANAVLIQSPTLIGSLRLLPNIYAPRDLVPTEETVALQPTLHFISSAAPLYPQSFFYVTVLLDAADADVQASKDEPYAIVVR